MGRPTRTEPIDSEDQAVKRGNLLSRCKGHVPATRCYMPSKWASRIEQISQVPVVDFGCFVRVAHRNGPNYGICGLLERQQLGTGAIKSVHPERGKRRLLRFVTSIGSAFRLERQ
jgi:hypothetical protein